MNSTALNISVSVGAVWDRRFRTISPKPMALTERRYISNKTLSTPHD